MSRENRLKLIKLLEEKRDSNVICYITSDREGIGGSISEDAVRCFYDLLLNLNKKSKIDLFIYSQGGAGETPWKIVPLIKEFCNEFNILIPYKAYSAATLIALGSDTIVMGKKGELGPVDASIKSEYHPKSQYQDTPLLIGVETIFSYIKLFKEKVGITDQSEISKSFNILSEKVGPLALGELNRFYEHNKLLIEKILRTKKEIPNEQEIKELVDNLTEKIFFHGHAINRNEAKTDFKLNIENADKEIEEIMWDLFLEYENDLDIKNPFDPEQILENSKKENLIEKNIKTVFLESNNKAFTHTVDCFIQRTRKIPTNLPLTINFNLPAEISKDEINTSLLNLIDKQIRESVVNQIIDLCPIIDIRLKIINSKWIEEN